MVPQEPDVDYIKRMANLIRKCSRRYKFAIVTGGGKDARIYARAMREIVDNEFLADQAAIMSTWQNAYLILAALHDISYKALPKSFDEAAEALDHHKVVVMGGFQPGLTTDSDAVLLAERVGSKRLINISNVPGIYDKDPRKHKRAKIIPEMKVSKLIEMAAANDSRKAGENFVFDVLASKLLARSGIEAHFVSGHNLDDLKKAIKGKKHGGTKVTP